MKTTINYKETERPVESVTMTFSLEEAEIIGWLAYPGVLGRQAGESVNLKDGCNRLFNKIKEIVPNVGCTPIVSNKCFEETR